MRPLVVLVLLLGVAACGQYDDSQNRHETCNQMGGNYTEHDGTWTCTNRVK